MHAGARIVAVRSSSVALSLVGRCPCHAWWATGRIWPSASASALAHAVIGDGRNRMPPPWQCAAVALVLAAVAAWPWVMLRWPDSTLVLIGSIVIGAVFFLRGTAGYSPRWRGHFRPGRFAPSTSTSIAALPGAGRRLHQAADAGDALMSSPGAPLRGPLRVGVGGPVGSGKTALVERLCKTMRDAYDIAVVTNDIYTKEDAEFLTRAGALAPDRIVGVETGGCPHTAIREDASINLAAVSDIVRKWPDLEIVFVESGGDNLAATFSPELADLTIYVIDVAAGEKIPRKGGPGITRSDLLVINKIDLAPLVGANLDVMDRDARRMRGQRPFLFSNLKENKGVDEIAAFIVRQGGLPAGRRNEGENRCVERSA